MDQIERLVRRSINVTDLKPLAQSTLIAIYRATFELMCRSDEIPAEGQRATYLVHVHNLAKYLPGSTRTSRPADPGSRLRSLAKVKGAARWFTFSYSTSSLIRVSVPGQLLSAWIPLVERERRERGSFEQWRKDLFRRSSGNVKFIGIDRKEKHIVLRAEIILDCREAVEVAQDVLLEKFSR